MPFKNHELKLAFGHVKPGPISNGIAWPLGLTACLIVVTKSHALLS